MKKPMLLLAAVTLLVSCQPDSKQHFTSSPEIDLIKKSNAAYVAGNWKTMRTVYADTAKVFGNTWHKNQGITAGEFIKQLEANAANYSDYKISEDAIYEMVITDTGEKWVYNWFQWSGTHKNGTKVKMPIHIAFLIVNGKVAFQAHYFDQLPAFLAENPLPVVKAELVK
jgi:hypothetical protein